MREMTSTEFRRAYPRLEEPVRVTSDGRAIGTWTPVPTLASQFLAGPQTTSAQITEAYPFAVTASRPLPRPEPGLPMEQAMQYARHDTTSHGHVDRPFTPAPKPTAKAKPERRGAR